MQRPKNWPEHLSYLSSPLLSKKLGKDQIAILRTKPANSPELPLEHSKSPSSFVKIVPITSPDHPACGQCGLFATKSMKPGSPILIYLGNFHVDEAGVEKSDYDLWLDRDLGVAVDAEKAGNEARFINDYRGVSDRPNAEFKEVWSVRHQMRCMSVFVLPEGKKGKSIHSSSGISKGEEILVSYGKGFWSHRLQ